MTYEVVFLPEAIDDLRRLDRGVAQRILRKVKWLSENFDDLSPEALAAEFKDLFKLRVGSYRVIYQVSENSKVLAVHFVGHRRDVYKRR